MKRIIVFLIMSGWCLSATYYIATTGNDTTGTGEISTPWKTIQKGIDTAVAGDTVYIRAGTYREELVLKRSGSSGLPITISSYAGETVVLDGSTAMTSWTQCGAAEEGLTRGGSTNANATSIYKATILLSSIPWKNNSSSGTKLALFNDGVFCELAMNPDTGIMIGHNTDQDSWTAPDADSTSTVLQDDSEFTTTDTDYYKECLVLVYVGGNAIQWKYASSFSADDNQITLSTECKDSQGNPIDLGASNLYAICNNPMDIDAAGEYCYTWTADGSGLITVYYYPNNAGELTDGSLSIGTLNRAIDTNNYDYITINGIEIRNYCQSTSDTAVIAPIMQGDSTSYLHTDWEISNCNIHDFAYEYLIYAYLKNFKFHHNTLSNVGFGVNGTFILSTTNNAAYPSYYCDNVQIYNNTFTGACQSTGIRFLVTRNSAIYNNTFTYDTGNHGNGMSFYQGCYNCVFAYNYSKGKNIRLTIQDVGDQSYAVGSGLGGSIYVYSNIFQTSTDDAQCLAWWIDTTSRDDTGSVYIINNMFTSGGEDNYALYLNNNDQGGPAYVYNNIIEYCEKGAWSGEAASVYSNNVHIGFPSASGYAAGDFSAGGKLENDLLYDGDPGHADIISNFTGYDYTNGDYALVDDGAADGGGISIVSYLPIAYFSYLNFSQDIAGVARNLGAPSIGPLEAFAAEGAAPTKATILTPSNGGTMPLFANSLMWEVETDADSVDIYFGIDSSPDSTEFLINQAAMYYYYNLSSHQIQQDYDTTYYWRIDAKNAYGTTTGDIWSFTTGSDPETPTTVNIPNLIGLSKAAAQNQITSNAFVEGTITYNYSTNYSYGTVTAQSPEAETEAQTGDSIDLIVSLGTQPDIDNLTVCAVVVSATSESSFTVASPLLSGSYKDCVVIVQHSDGKRAITLVSGYNEDTNTISTERPLGFTPEEGDTVYIGNYVFKKFGRF